MENMITWKQFGKDFILQLVMLFRPTSGTRQLMMKKIVIYALAMSIGLLGMVGLLSNERVNETIYLLIPVIGLLQALVSDVRRYRRGETLVSEDEMGSRSPRWVRWAIAIFGLAVLGFVIYLFVAVID